MDIDEVELPLKRKDFTPKKEERESSSSNKRLAATRDLFPCNDVIEISDGDSSDDDILLISASDNHHFTMKQEYSESSVKTEHLDSDGDDEEDEDDIFKGNPKSYYKDEKSIPIVSQANFDLKDIFRVCMKGTIPDQFVCSKRPFRVKENATFIIEQKKTNVVHLLDLDSDDLGLKFSKSENIRFYQVDRERGKNFKISHEVSVQKNVNGQVIAGSFKERKGRYYEEVAADINKVYAVIRRRATFNEDHASLTRNVTYIMDVPEFNEKKNYIREKKHFYLKHPLIILNYSVIGEIKSTSHSTYRKTQHSTRKSIEELVNENPNAKPRHILDGFENKESIFDKSTTSSAPKNLQEIKNIKYSQAKKNNEGIEDEISAQLSYLLSQPSIEDIVDPSSECQPFLQEIIFRHGKQPSYVLFLKQSLLDIERFGTNKSAPTSFRTVLAIDTTFNIGEHYFTQTTYRNLSLLRKDTLQSPWFPGPVLIHRHQRKEDFAYMWQAVKRGNKNLSDIALIGTDECTELYGGILEETDENTGHLLGKEHVLNNIKRKLERLSYPSKQTRWILNDIFGHPFESEKSGLLQSNSFEEFDAKYALLKGKWIDIEKNYTVRNGYDFVSYFEKFKLNHLKTKMCNATTKRLQTKEHGQNPIEWLNYLAKDEIDSALNTKGSHRHSTILTCIKKLKERSLRLYRNSIKALYGEGPYILSPAFQHLKHDYDEFFDLDREERKELTKRLFTYMPSEKTLKNNGYVFEEDSLNDAVETNETATLPVTTIATSHTSKSSSVNSKNTSTSTSNTNIVNPENIPIQTDGGVIATVKSVSSNSRHQKLPFIPEDFNLCKTFGMNKEIVEDVFQKARCLLDKPNGVLVAASSEERMRTVEGDGGITPCIVKPAAKNPDFLTCSCQTNKLLDFCHHTLAASADIGISFRYMNEVIKKLSSKKKFKKSSHSFSSALNASLTASQKGKKKNEIIQKKKLPKAVSLTNQTMPTKEPSKSLDINNGITDRQTIDRTTIPADTSSQSCSSSVIGIEPTARNGSVQQSSPVSVSLQSHLTQASKPPTQCSPKVPAYTFPPQFSSVENSQIGQYRVPQSVTSFQYHQPSFLQPQSFTQSSQSTLDFQLPPLWRPSSIPLPMPMIPQIREKWSTSMSPYKYEVILLPAIVTMCYGCTSPFVDKYRKEPFNVIIKHRDRRIRGVGEDGLPIYNPDFANTYYHLNIRHIRMKNENFKNSVYISSDIQNQLTAGQINQLAQSGLHVEIYNT